MMQEREINLIDLIVEVFLHWRMFIVWMLCGAVLFAGFSYVRTWQSANTQAAQVEDAKRQLEEVPSEDIPAEPIDPELLQQLMDQLDDNQLRNVEYVLAFEELFRERLSYQEESILMQMDADNVQKAVVSVWITSESDEKSYEIEAVYEDTVQGGRMIQYVADRLGMTVSNVSELISLSHKTSGVTSIGGNDDFTLTVIHYDEKVCRNMVQAIVKFIENEKGDLETAFGEFETVIVAQEPAAAYYPSITTSQRSLLSDIIALQDTITNRKNNFTDEQSLYYDAVTKGKIIVLNAEESDSEEIIDIASLEEIIQRGVTVTPGISLRYVLLGMVLAVFVYAFYIFMIYILNTRIRITDNLQQLYEIPQLGQISGNKEEKKRFIFIDKWILSLRNRNKRKFTKEEAVKLASVAVKMAAERNSVNSVYLIGCDLKEQALAVCEQIKESLDQSGLNRGSLQVNILSNVLYDAQAMSNLENAQGVVLVEQAGSTLYDEISQELQLLNRQGIKALGGIIVE